MDDMEVEELRGPFDTIIRRFRQKAQELEGEGKDDAAQHFYLDANKITELKKDVIKD